MGRTQDRRIAPSGGWVSLAVLGAFLLLEAGVGLRIGSLALLADAGHMLTDVVGVSMGMVALVLARRGSAAAARTFGWHRAEVLTAMANAVLLLGVAAWVMYEAINRIGDTPEIPGAPLILTASAGLAANIVVMLLLRGDAKEASRCAGPTWKCSPTRSAPSGFSSPVRRFSRSAGVSPTSSSVC